MRIPFTAADIYRAVKDGKAGSNTVPTRPPLVVDEAVAHWLMFHFGLRPTRRRADGLYVFPDHDGHASRLAQGYKL